MKILIVLHKQKKLGGAVLQIMKIAKELKQKKNSVYIFSIDTYYKTNSFIKNYIISIKALQKLSYKFKPDVILASDPYITNICAKLANVNKSSIFIRIGAVFDSFYSARLSSQLFGRAKTPIFYQFFLLILKLSAFLLLKRNSFIIFNSHFLRRKYYKLTSKSTVIHNGVDIKETLKKEIVSSNYINLVYVGRIEPRKSIEIIIQSLYYLKQKQVDFSFSLVGNINYDIKYWMKLKQMINKYSLQKKVNIIGEIDNENLSEFLQKHDILLFSTDSRNFPITEGMPNVILEGMANGLAIISTSVAGVPEIISSENGFIVQPDPEEFAEKIEYLFNNRKMLVKIKKNNYQIIKDKYNIEKVANKYLAVFSKAIKNNII